MLGAWVEESYMAIAPKKVLALLAAEPAPAKKASAKKKQAKAAKKPASKRPTKKKARK
jgi:hypothetical protein